MVRTFTLIATDSYTGRLASAAKGEVLDVSAPIAAALLRTGKFQFHTRVVEPGPARRRRYRRRDLVAE